MEDLFRMVLLRPAVAQDKRRPSIDLTQNSKYQNDLRTGLGSDDPRKGARAASRAFVSLKRFIGDPDENPFDDRLEKLERVLGRMQNVTPDAVRKAVEKIFGHSIADIVAADNFADTMSRLRDSIVAIKFLQEEQTRPIEELVGQLRLMELIAALDDDATFPEDADALRVARFRTLQLPDEATLTSALSTRKAVDDLKAKAKADTKKREAEIKDLLDRHEKLRAALAELEKLDPSHFAVTAQKKTGGVAPPDKLTPRTLADEHAQFRSKMLDLLVKGAAAPAAPSGVSGSLVEALLGTGIAQTGRPGFTPQTAPFVLGAAGVKKLSSDTRKLLAARGIDLTDTPVDRAADLLQAELARTSKEIERATGHPTKKSLKRIGDALVSIETPLTSGWGAIGTGGLLAAAYVRPDGRVPHTKGAVAPAGIADLLLVKQQLTGYEAADVAHIENVLKGERKVARAHPPRGDRDHHVHRDRDHDRARSSELETTDRFEMTRETSETIKEDVALKAGADDLRQLRPDRRVLGQRRGVALALQGGGDQGGHHVLAGRHRAQLAEDRRAGAGADHRDVDHRDDREEHPRARQHRRARATSPASTSGSTRSTRPRCSTTACGRCSTSWSPSRRAFLIGRDGPGAHERSDADQAAGLHAAPVADHREQLRLLGQGVPARPTSRPPPELYQHEVAPTSRPAAATTRPNYNHSRPDRHRRRLPRGLRHASARCATSGSRRRRARRRRSGRRTQRLTSGELAVDDDARRRARLDPVRPRHLPRLAGRRRRRGEVSAHRPGDGEVAAGDAREADDRYQARLADYEEKLAALKLQAGVAIRGRNPAANQIMIEDELKKNCVSILTDQHFDLFDAIDNAPSNGLPQIDVFEAAGEGAVRPLLRAGLRVGAHDAGSPTPTSGAARTSGTSASATTTPTPRSPTSCRPATAGSRCRPGPGFEGAIDHFLTFGEIWNGGPLPPISSPLYLPIADEIAEQLDRPGDEVPQGDPWTVRVPTNLVHLRADDQLPRWKQNAQGDWVESP